MNDEHARHDEGGPEPRGAKLRRDLKANAAAEIEKQVTEPHEIEQPDRGDREPRARSKCDEREPGEKRRDRVPDGGGASECLRKPRLHDARNEKGDADESKRLWEDKDGERRGARLRLEPRPDDPEPERRVRKEAET